MSDKLGAVRDKCHALLQLAKQVWGKDKQLSLRYVELARKTAMRHRFKLGRRQFCKKCNAPFIPGETLRVRISKKDKAVLWKCGNCGGVIRFRLR